MEGLTNEQLVKLQDFFQTSPRLEHSFKVKNPKTGVDSEFTVSGLQAFFG